MSTSKRKNTKKYETTFFPLFEECSKYTLDTHWKKIFIDCSQNKFPTNITYDSVNNSLFVRDNQKNSSIQYPLNGLTETEVFSKMLEIFKSLGMYSTREIRNYLIQSKKKEEIPTEWKKVRPKKAREILLVNFIKNKSEQFELSPRETKKLTSVIFVGLQLGEIKHTDIILKNGVIKRIVSLVIEETPDDEHTIYIEIPKSDKKEKTQTQKISNTSKFYTHYEKFLKDSFSNTNKEFEECS